MKKGNTKIAGLIGIILITTFMLSSCNYVKNVRLLTGGSVDRKDYVETIPFEFKKGLIVLSAQINQDTSVRKFIFDTGAFNSKIEKALAEDLGLPTVATKDNSTAQGNSKKIEVTRIPFLQLGNTIFKNIGAGKLEYDASSASPCIAKDGIIGANLIKLAHWNIDYSSKTVQFSDRAFELESDADHYNIPFKKPLLSGVPEIEIKVEGRSVSGVLFDVGYNGGLILPASFAHLFSSDKETKVIDQSTTGIYGSNIDTLITKELNVSIGGYPTQIPVEFSSIGKALLGNEFLQHFRVLINYNKKRITLIPQKEVTMSFGVEFIPGVLNDSLWVVNRTTPESSLSLGDTLTFINGEKPSDLFNNYCDYVNNIGRLLDTPKMKVTTLSGKTLFIKDE